MKKLLLSFVLILFAMPSLANQALMIVRHNAKIIDYTKQMKLSVDAAKRKKHDVIFDVVAFAPQYKSQEASEKSLANTKNLGSKFVNELIASGAARDRVTFRTQPAAVPDPEIHLFVR